MIVKSRHGGELIRLPGRVGHHPLKKLFQEFSVPPWYRAIIPLLYVNGKFAGVAGRCWAEEFFSRGGEPCYDVVWERDK